MKKVLYTALAVVLLGNLQVPSVSAKQQSRVCKAMMKTVHKNTNPVFKARIIRKCGGKKKGTTLASKK